MSKPDFKKPRKRGKPIKRGALVAAMAEYQRAGGAITKLPSNSKDDGLTNPYAPSPYATQRGSGY